MNTIYIYAGAFHISRDAAAEYNILRESSNFVPCNTIDVNDGCFIISLLNTKSWKDMEIIKRDKCFMENDELCLTEIYVFYENDVSDIIEQLYSFEVYLKSCVVIVFKILDSVLTSI